MISELVTPIPELKPVAGWKELPIHECGEPLVPLGPFLTQYPHSSKEPGHSDLEDGFIPGQPDVGFSKNIFADTIYSAAHTSSPYRPGELDGALLTMFAREGVAKRLVEAASYLPEGYALLIWDSYRPLSVQKALYDDYYGQLIEKGLSPEQATVKAQKLVSIPSKDPTRPSPHNTGGAIDLTIVKFDDAVLADLREANEKLISPKWQDQYEGEMKRMWLLRHHSMPLDMGTAFDSATSPEKTETRYYEKKIEAGEKLSANEIEQLNNRRLLYNAMTRAGFSNYPDEWWHFDFGNQFDAIRTGRTAIYGAAVYTDACKKWENMRRGHYSGTLGMQKALESGVVNPIRRVSFLGENGFFQKAFEVAWGAVRNGFGNLRNSKHPQAERLTLSQ